MTGIRRRSGSGLALLLLLAPASALAAEIPAKFADAHAVVLEETRAYTLRLDKRVLQMKTRVLLRNRAGFEVADRSVFYDAGRGKISGLSARTRRADGRVVEVPSDLIRDVVLFKDEQREWHALQFTFPALEPGAVIEWSYELEEESGAPWSWWDVQRDIPVLDARFSIRYKKHEAADRFVRMYSRAPHGAHCGDLPVRDERAYRVHEFACRDVPAFEDERFSPPDLDLRLRLLITWAEGFLPLDVQMWGAINHYWRERIETFTSDRDAVRARARSIASDTPSIPEKVDRIWSWVREHVALREESFERGLEGLEGQAKSVDEVLQRGFGLPDEITLLTLVLLQEAGVPVFPVLTGDRSRGRFVHDMPDIEQVDHLILEIGSESIGRFLDPACRFCQPGVPHWKRGSGEKTGVRIAAGWQPPTVDLPAIRAQDNSERWKQRVALAPDGSGAVEGRVAWIGRDDVHIRERWEGMTVEGRREDFMKRIHGDVGEIDSEPADPDVHDQFMNVRFSYTRRDSALPAPGRLLLRPFDVYTGRLGVFRQEHRRHPLWWPYAYSVASETVFALPEGHEALWIPPPARFDGPGLRFEGQWSPGAEGRELVWRGVLIVLERSIEQENYEAALGFLERLRRALREGPIVEAGAGPAGEAPR